MARAVEACVHCGFCLPTCPTYVDVAQEMDSPRGRIFLMKAALENKLAHDEAVPYVDRCLGCMACVTACPSGVAYSELLLPYRERVEGKRSRKPCDRLARFLVRNTLPYPSRFRWAVAAGKWARSLMPSLPRPLAAMLALLPEYLPPARPLPAHFPAQGARRARVALLAGCVQQALAPEVGWASLRVLARNGVEVIVPPSQGCCGSLMFHSGEAAAARALARRNLRAFSEDVDAIVTNTAGCGSGMKEYGLLFSGCVEAAEASRFAARVRDVSEFLSEIGIVPPTVPQSMRAAYHDACHLAHAQGVAQAPRRLLSQAPGITLIEIPEGELCCGSAGTYNIEQPELADSIGRRKAENILSTGAEAVIAGNIGCIIQIRTQLARLGSRLPVRHTVEVLDRAYG